MTERPDVRRALDDLAKALERRSRADASTSRRVHLSLKWTRDRHGAPGSSARTSRGACSRTASSRTSTAPDSDCWRLDDVAARRHHPARRRRPGTRRRGRIDRTADWILHLAAHGAYSWQTDHAAILRANVVGTANMLEAARRADSRRSSTRLEFRIPASRITRRSRTTASSPTARTRSPRRSRPRCSAVTWRGEGSTTCARCGSYSTYGPGKSRSAWCRPSQSKACVAGFRRRRPADGRDFVGWATSSTRTSRRPGIHEEPGAVYNVGTGTQTTIGDAAIAGRSWVSKASLGNDDGPLLGHRPLDRRQLQDPANAELAPNTRLPRGIRGARLMVPAPEPDLLSYYVTARA